ncbi:mucoidy inhibitor MuiA family protein [Embleya sp. NPDC127516]|uniref:mucoidy inhibitor MuiA family protein n=1 Tax=Embleya sp. NPDC127516 TaxID=3363990 RepID=UPI00381F993F
MTQPTLEKSTPAERKPEPLPITAVTCLEDRAQVTRSGRIEVAEGVQRVLVGPVTPLAVDRSLRVEVIADDGSATAIDARVVRVYTPRPATGPGPDASELRRLVHDLDERRVALSRHSNRLHTRLTLIAQARTELRRNIAEQTGFGTAEPERWATELDRLSAEAEDRHAELHALADEQSSVERRLREARVALDVAEQEPAELTATVEVVIEAERTGSAELRVVHLVPCALWRPAYRATLAPDRRSIELECDAVVWQRTGEDWSGVALSLSTARPTLAARPPSLVEDRLTLRERTQVEKKQVEVDLREEEIATVGRVAGGSAELPGVDDGGEVRVLAAPAPVEVPSDGRPHRVRLTTFTAACEPEAACAPELSQYVSQVVRFANDAGHALLAGPVELVRGSGYAGRGQLDFAAPGEEVRLPFGSEDDFRVVRDVTESRTTASLTGRTVVTRTVTVFLSHIAAPEAESPGTVVLRERVPVSEVSAVEVKVRGDLSEPAPDAVDEQGIVRYDVRLTAGERRRITLVYELHASGKVTGL